MSSCSLYVVLFTAFQCEMSGRVHQRLMIVKWVKHSVLAQYFSICCALLSYPCVLCLMLASDRQYSTLSVYASRRYCPMYRCTYVDTECCVWNIWSRYTKNKHDRAHCN